VEWSPDSRLLLFCTTQSEVHVYDCNGNPVSKVKLFCMEGVAAGTSIIGIDWCARGGVGYTRALSTTQRPWKGYACTARADWDATVCYTAMKKVASRTLFRVKGRSRGRFPSTRWYRVPGATRTTLGFGNVHHSRAIFGRAVPNLSVTIRNLFLRCTSHSRNSFTN
jgi:hypothetical protein